MGLISEDGSPGHPRPTLDRLDLVQPGIVRLGLRQRHFGRAGVKGRNRAQSGTSDGSPGKQKLSEFYLVYIFTLLKVAGIPKYYSKTETRLFS